MLAKHCCFAARDLLVQGGVRRIASENKQARVVQDSLGRNRMNKQHQPAENDQFVSGSGRIP